MVTKQDGQLVRHRRGAMTMNLSPGWAKAALHSIVIDLTSRQCRVVISVRNLFDGMDAHTKNRLTFFAMMAALLLGGCGTSQPMQRGNGSSEYLDAVSRLSPGQAHDITIYAIGLVGTPYRFGGNTPDSGFDCSGLIGHVYKTRAEISPPRTVSKMQGWGHHVSGNGIRSGDLVIFAQSGVVTHAGIYVGNGRFVHAPSTGGEVRLDSLNSKYWAAQQVSFRRP